LGIRVRPSAPTCQPNGTVPTRSPRAFFRATAAWTCSLWGSSRNEKKIYGKRQSVAKQCFRMTRKRDDARRYWVESRSASRSSHDADHFHLIVFESEVSWRAISNGSWYSANRKFTGLCNIHGYVTLT
jgi:hypothetical protein